MINPVALASRESVFQTLILQKWPGSPLLVLRTGMNFVPIILFTWYADTVQPPKQHAGITAVVLKSNPTALQIRVKSLPVAA